MGLMILLVQSSIILGCAKVIEDWINDTMF